MHLPWRRVEFASEKCQRRRACLTLSRAICFRSKTPPKMTSVHPCWLKDLCFQGCWVTWHGKDYVVPALPSRKILCKGESAIKAFMTHACFAWCSLPLIWRIHQNAPCLFLSPPPPPFGFELHNVSGLPSPLTGFRSALRCFSHMLIQGESGWPSVLCCSLHSLLEPLCTFKLSLPASLWLLLGP